MSDANGRDDWAFGSGGFAKLYGNRLAQSSLLDRDVATRWVFVFALSQADAEGRYRCASVAGLARAAAVTAEQAAKAVEELEGPDPDSTTPDSEGRRIARITGGWKVVAYRRYREFRTARQIAAAERKRRERERGKRDMSHASRAVTVTSAPEGRGQITDITDCEASPRAPVQKRSPGRIAPKGVVRGETWPVRFATTWEETLGGVVAPGRLGKALKPLVARHGEEAVAAAWARYLETAAGLSRDERRFCSPVAFAARFGDYNGGPPQKPKAPEPLGPVSYGPRSLAR